MKSPIIISLGGSIVVPDSIDTAFLKDFKLLIEEEVRKGREFVVVLGGGRTARRYQAAGKEVAPSLTLEEADWLGIHAIRLNAELVRAIFGALAYERVVIKPSELRAVAKPLAVAGAEVPGHSSDYDAVEAARETGARRVVNLSNIDYVYDKDPKQFSDAKKIEKTSWKSFRAILPEEWMPGVNAPFDPIAAKRAEELGLEVAIMNGDNLENLKNYLDGKKFIGTIISNI